jgi:hypothetical protein
MVFDGSPDVAESIKAGEMRVAGALELARALGADTVLY